MIRQKSKTMRCKKELSKSEKKAGSKQKKNKKCSIDVTKCSNLSQKVRNKQISAKKQI